MATNLGSAPLLALQSPPKRIQRKRAPPTLHIETPDQAQPIVLGLGPHDSAITSLSSATSERSVDSFMRFEAPPKDKPLSLRNMKKLSLSLHSAASSTASLALPHPSDSSTSRSTNDASSTRSRSTSVSSYTASTATAALAARRHEDSEGGSSPTDPYANGPVEVLPGIWLGNEDNARDVDTLSRLGIKAILNVAKEVIGVDEVAAAHGFDYLGLDWSHGEKNLVKDGFPAGFAFVDSTRQNGGGVLVHCQLGVSRSGTMAIALVMRAAASTATDVPAEVLELKGMHAAYAYVKTKSFRVGPNMSLIYSLLDYEKSLKNDATSPADSDRASSIAEEEAEWSRRRQALEEQNDDEETENLVIRREAEALDQAMIDRQRRDSAASTSSAASSVVPKLGAVPAFRKRFTRGRHNSKASISSIRSFSSVISEDLVEVDEEAEVLGLGSAYDTGSRSPSVDESPVETPNDLEFTPRTARAGTAFVPLSAAPTKLSFGLLTAPTHKTEFGDLVSPLRTATQLSFNSDSTPRPKTRRRPTPLVDILPPVPSSPDAGQLAAEETQPAPMQVATKLAMPPLRRTRTKSGQPTPPPLFLRSFSSGNTPIVPPSSGPSQTLFVFPPSPKNAPAPSRTPSTMTLMSNLQQIPFPLVSPPRVATKEISGRRRSFVALGLPSTPTTACSRVDARGWFGQDS